MPVNPERQPKMEFNILHVAVAIKTASSNYIAEIESVANLTASQWSFAENIIQSVMVPSHIRIFLTISYGSSNRIQSQASVNSSLMSVKDP